MTDQVKTAETEKVNTQNKANQKKVADDISSVASPSVSYEDALKMPLKRFTDGSKIVTILRRNTSRVPQEVYKDAITKIGSEWKENTRSVLRGLTFEEEKAYLPRLLSIVPESPNWDRAVEDYWVDFSVRVPNEGLTLEIWTDQYGRPSEANLKDYIIYRFCQVSSKVAVTSEELENKAIYSYYVRDNAQHTTDKFARLQVTKKANLEFMKLFKQDAQGKLNMKKVDWVLEMYKRTDPTLGMLQKMGADAKEVYLSEKVLENPDMFLGFVEDPSLEHKAFISECVSVGILTKIGNVILNGEEKLGDDVEEAVLYLTSPKNSKLMITLSERLKIASEAVKTT